MRYSANLNIIIKALEKVSNHISRDFVELENLQANPVSANKFANSTYNRVKQILTDEFVKFRSDYNIFFSDNTKIIQQENAQYSFVINALDGLENFARSNPDFAVSVALQFHGENQSTQPAQTIAMAIFKIIGSELYYCEKGFGAFLNNRRIRVSKRSSANQLTITNDFKIVDQQNNFYNFGCFAMAVAYFSSARVEKVIYKINNANLSSAFLLIAKEAGGSVEITQDKIILSNS